MIIIVSKKLKTLPLLPHLLLLPHPLLPSPLPPLFVPSPPSITVQLTKKNTNNNNYTKSRKKNALKSSGLTLVWLSPFPLLNLPLLSPPTSPNHTKTKNDLSTIFQISHLLPFLSWFEGVSHVSIDLKFGTIWVEGRKRRGIQQVREGERVGRGGEGEEKGFLKMTNIIPT